MKADKKTCLVDGCENEAGVSGRCGRHPRSPRRTSRFGWDRGRILTGRTFPGGLDSVRTNLVESLAEALGEIHANAVVDALDTYLAEDPTDRTAPLAVAPTGPRGRAGRGAQGARRGGRARGEGRAGAGQDEGESAPASSKKRGAIQYMKPASISQEALHLMERGAPPSEALSAQQTSQLSNRRRVLREASRRGRWFALVSRVREGPPLNRAEARLSAAVSAAGRDLYQNCAVPPHWRPLFERAFVKAALCAASTDRSVTVSSKYGC